jgi:Sec-independent protein secretion pathway component TatC
MLAVPLWLLFELGLLVARFISVPKPDGDVATQAESKSD